MCSYIIILIITNDQMVEVDLFQMVEDLFQMVVQNLLDDHANHGGGDEDLLDGHAIHGDDEDQIHYLLIGFQYIHLIFLVNI